MLEFILKSSACLAIFMLFYKLVLEKISVHRLKRYYLLAAVLLSFSIPIITFTTYIEPISNNSSSLTEIMDAQPAPEIVEETPSQQVYFILWVIYGIGVLIFTIKFWNNLNSLRLKILRNEKRITANAINILIKDLIIPHTFLKFIFLNQAKYEEGSIPKEVIWHEEAHVIQKHSLDILFIEALQILFWFNPLFYLLKKDIKLNHEFLADASVIKRGAHTSVYQNIILEFSSIKPNEASLVNAINYSSIKKRLTIMKTQTSKQNLWFRTALILPLVALTLYGFSSTEEVKRPKEKSNDPKVEYVASELKKADANKINYIDSLNELELILSENNELLNNGEVISLTEIKSLFQKNNKLYVSMKIENVNQYELGKSLMQNIRDLGIKKTRVCTSFQHNVDLTQVKGENLKEVLLKIQDQASKEQVAEYNAWAKKLNAELKEAEDNKSDYPIIKKKEVQKYIEIYSIMSDEQRRHAEPMPVPPPPPVPAAPNSKNDLKEKQVMGYPNPNSIEAPPPPPPAVPAPKSDLEEVMVVGQPAPPPPPISPLEHVLKMAKKNASFFLEGKQISSDQAIETLKKNSHLNINTVNSDSKNPKVYISKKPYKN